MPAQVCNDQFFACLDQDKRPACVSAHMILGRHRHSRRVGKQR